MHKKKVLIVDDERDALFILEKELAARGYAVIAADNGKDAMVLAKSNRPDLIILDLEMSDMYGGDVLFNNGFWLDDDAEINVFYSSVIVQERPYEILGYHLLDGSEFMLDQFTEYEIGQINFVPEPATIVLFAIGALLLRNRH